MILARRKFLHIAASALALPMMNRTTSAETVRPLAERLADYADRLRFDDLDAATIERVKAHVIDTLGCGPPPARGPAGAPPRGGRPRGRRRRRERDRPPPPHLARVRSFRQRCRVP